MSDFQGLPKTTNLNLNKPGYDNVADIMALNENADIIDAAIKTNIDDIANIKKGYVKTVNGVGVDSKGNVNVKEYTHPASGVTAGSYRKVTVDDLGHVTAGENPILAIAEGGTGADNATSALSKLGILGAIVNASVSGKTITFTKKDNTKFSIDTQDTNNGIVAALLEQNGYVKFANGLILQWGFVKKTVTTYDFDWVYPIPFPHAAWMVQFTPQYTKHQCRQHAINSFDKTSCSLRSDGTSPELDYCHLLAIGY